MSRISGAPLVRRLVTRQPSPPRPILAKASTMSMGDLIKVAPGSPTLMVVDPEEPAQEETPPEAAREVSAQIVAPEEAVPKEMV
jgi:hypothetical protein